MSVIGMLLLRNWIAIGANGSLLSPVNWRSVLWRLMMRDVCYAYLKEALIKSSLLRRCNASSQAGYFSSLVWRGCPIRVHDDGFAI